MDKKQIKQASLAVATLTACLLFSLPATAKNRRIGEIMPLKQAKEQWQQKKFTVEAWQKADLAERGSFAVSVIESQRYQGEKVDKVRKELGLSQGMYFSERHPAYLLDRNFEKGKASWQLVFLADNERYIEDVFIQLNASEVEQIKKSGILQKLRNYLQKRKSKNNVPTKQTQPGTKTTERDNSSKPPAEKSPAKKPGIFSGCAVR